jgi:fucose 4-O-acetylase-like acetyltransferase
MKIAKKKSRNNTIDMLRGIGIIVMIYLHTSAFFKFNPILNFTWDFGHFAVQTFVFCSAYVFFAVGKAPKSLTDFWQYLKKRIVRLIIPFYIFFAFYLIFLLLSNPDSITWSYFWKTITLIGGQGINWLVLLFVYVMIILPFIDFLFKKSKILFYLYGAIALVGSIFFIYHDYGSMYRFVMWLTWSLIIYFSFLLFKMPKTAKNYILLSGGTLLIFAGLYYYFTQIGHTTVLISNKYPPNIFYLVYGMGIITLLYWLLESFPIKENSLLFKSLKFFSIYSYSLFFIQNIAIKAVNLFIEVKEMNFILYFTGIVLLSVAIQWVINKIFS